MLHQFRYCHYGLILTLTVLFVSGSWGFTDNNLQSSIRPQLVTRPRFPSYYSYSPLPRNPDHTGERFMAMSDREKDIRRLVAQLKEQGKLKPKTISNDDGNNDTSDFIANSLVDTRAVDYAAKIQAKLGKTKSRMLGYNSLEDDETISRGAEEYESDEDDEEYDDDDESDVSALDVQQFVGRIGSTSSSSTTTTTTTSTTIERSTHSPVINPSLFADDHTTGMDLSDDDLALLVSEKMSEIKQQEMTMLNEERSRQGPPFRVSEQGEEKNISSVQIGTTGVGGKWIKNATAASDMYKPKSGSWGAFPRPRDVSEAFGGGRRVGVGYLNEQAKSESEEATRERLRQYRERVGIEVQSEKDYAADIDEALSISAYAMQRGLYSTAVSALEKVTRHCSSNSKVGGRVFLELAMAYEAVGQSAEAATVYTTLTKCRIEEIRYNAKQLLYGLEAIQFMQNNVGNTAFSRKRASSVFIDTTGLANFAQNFDDVYNTAYIDLEKGFYQKLTQSVVRSTREARQILLRATSAGEVERLRIVQALRSLSRKFDDALQEEISQNAPAPEPVAVLDGKPIVGTRLVTTRTSGDDNTQGMNGPDFILSNPQQMVDNIDGEWRLQLLADKQGDGVTFFNSTLSWQCFNTETMSFSSQCPSGFTSIHLSGDMVFHANKRILRRNSVTMGGGVFLGLFANSKTGAMGAIRLPQQVITVDSVLLITRGVPSKQNGLQKMSIGSTSSTSDKDYFAVWRRVERGAYSSSISNQR